MTVVVWFYLRIKTQIVIEDDQSKDGVCQILNLYIVAAMFFYDWFFFKVEVGTIMELLLSILSWYNNLK